MIYNVREDCNDLALMKSLPGELKSLKVKIESGACY